jgi:hypothetical protein
LTIKQIPQLDGETGARARSAMLGNTLYLANIPTHFAVSQRPIEFLAKVGRTTLFYLDLPSGFTSDSI